MEHHTRPAGHQSAEPVEGERHEAELTAMLEDMYGGGSTEATAGQRPDAALAESVQQAQDGQPTVEAGQIRSSVEQGWATLDGEVDSAAEQQQAERAALEVPGVRGVRNRVRRRGNRARREGN
jgi:osmotically-inducible protein OsmY